MFTWVLLCSEFILLMVCLDKKLFIWDECFMALSNVMISFIVPYSCQLFNMCSANADCGLLLLMYHMCSW